MAATVTEPAMSQPDALILCGGQSTRLGGIDKPLCRLAGRPLVEQVLRRVAPQTGRIIISANRNAEDYARYAGVIVDDGPYAGFGPLAGIAAGLAASTSDSLLCVPGDAPWLPADLSTRLAAARHSAATSIAHVDDGRGPQPLCCLVAVDLLEDLHRYLDAGGRTPREWFMRHGAASADFSAWPRWAWSLNTSAEWQEAEQRLATAKLSE